MSAPFTAIGVVSPDLDDTEMTGLVMLLIRLRFGMIVDEESRPDSAALQMAEMSAVSDAVMSVGFAGEGMEAAIGEVGMTVYVPQMTEHTERLLTVHCPNAVVRRVRVSRETLDGISGHAALLSLFFPTLNDHE